MIQNILPSRLNNSWQNIQPQPESFVMCFREGRLLAKIADGEPQFPRYRDLSGHGSAPVYLFSINHEAFFLADAAKISGFQDYSLHELRDRCAGKYLYAAFTAYHLYQWYADNRYCGVCRGAM